MIEQLHDLVDAREDAMNQARDRAREIIKSNIVAAMRETKDFNKALEVVTMLVENELATMTTGAAVKSFDIARKIFR